MRLKFINLNVWFGGTLWDPMLDFFKKENPDILALQEVQFTHDPFIEQKRFKTLDYLSPKLGLPNRIFTPAFSRIDAEGLTKVDVGNAVLARQRLVKAEHWFYDGMQYGEMGKEGDVDSSKHPRNLQHVSIQINDKLLHIFNTHGLWGIDGNDTLARLAMSKFILDKIGNHHPAILCGDFNTDATSKSMKQIGAVLHDVFAEDKRITSFNMRQKPKGSGYQTAVVDFIFTTPDIKVLSHTAPDVDVSDHCPLVIEFDL